MTTEELRSGSTLAGRYRVRSRGTSRELGTAYVAWDTIEARAVHVLVLAPRYGTGQEVMRKLARIQQDLAALELPALVPFALVGAQRRREAEGRLFLVRALQEGETLASRLAREGRLEVGAAVEIATGLCRVLSVAHRHRLVHGSLTPDHVLLQDDGGLLVTGAGIWPALQPGNAPGAPAATPSPWRSPEQVSGQVTLPSSDVFTIGALLYYALCGQPFGPTHAYGPARQEPPSLQEREPRIPGWLAQVVHKTLAQEPSQRYRNAGQLLQILRSGARAGLEPTTSKPRALSSARQAFRPSADALARSSEAESLLEASSAYADTYTPDAWTYVPGTDLPAVHDPTVRYRRRRRDRVDTILLMLLIILVLGVLGLIAVWWTVYQRWSASLEPTQSLPYQRHEDVLPAHSLYTPQRTKFAHAQMLALWQSSAHAGRDYEPFLSLTARAFPGPATSPALGCNWNPGRISAIIGWIAAASGPRTSLDAAALGVELTAWGPGRSRMQTGWLCLPGPLMEGRTWQPL